MNNCPKYIKIYICSGLDIQDLCFMTVVNKDWYNLLISDDFWMYKGIQEYGELTKTKPEYLSGKEWYKRLGDSGDFYNYDYDLWLDFHKKTFIKENIWYYRYCYGRYYYVDVWDQLWYCQDLYHPRPCSLYGQHIDYNKDEEKQLCNIGTYLLNQGITITKEPQKVKLMDAIKDIRPTHIGDFILTRDNKLYIIGLETNKPILVCEKVKSIGGTWHLVFYITLNDNLYIFTCQNIKLKRKLIANNVSHARGHRQDDSSSGEYSLVYFKSDKNYMLKCNEITVSTSLPNDKFIIKNGNLFSDDKYMFVRFGYIDTNVIKFYAPYYKHIHYIKRRSNCEKHI